jgi:hypothetical protein
MRPNGSQPANGSAPSRLEGNCEPAQPRFKRPNSTHSTDRRTARHTTTVWPSHTHPYYAPAIVAALAASIGMTVGSLGPWVTLLLSVNGLEAGGCGVITLSLGTLSGAAILALLLWPHSVIGPRWTVPVAWGAAVAGTACLASIVPILMSIETAPVTTFMDLSISPEVGWGLWLVIVCAAALCASAAFIATQVGQHLDRLEPGQRRHHLWTNGWRTAAITAATLLLSATIIYVFARSVTAAADPLPAPTTRSNFLVTEGDSTSPTNGLRAT